MSGPRASPGSGQPVSARCAAGRSSGPFCGLVQSPGSPRTSARCLREPAVSGDLPVGPLGPGRGSGRRCVSQVQTLSLCQGVGLERPGRASTSESSGHGTGERGARTGLCRLPTRLCGGRRPLHFSGNLHFYSVCVSFFFFFFLLFQHFTSVIRK